VVTKPNLDDLTLNDLAEWGLKHGIRFDPKIVANDESPPKGLYFAPYYVVDTLDPNGWVRLAGPGNHDVMLRSNPAWKLKLGERLHLTISRADRGQNTVSERTEFGGV
jgi:hypothetical protein